MQEVYEHGCNAGLIGLSGGGLDSEIQMRNVVAVVIRLMSILSAGHRLRANGSGKCYQGWRHGETGPLPSLLSSPLFVNYIP